MSLASLANFLVRFLVHYCLFFREILNRVGSSDKFLARFESFIRSHLGFYGDSSLELECSAESLCSREDGFLCREDVEAVMARLGIFCHPEGEKLQEKQGTDDLSNMFEEKEPSLEELKQAFDVFDQNGDGFIDSQELQRVLCALGMKDGLEMEHCRVMIASFDLDGDGRIDFCEFVKLMENTFV